MMGHKEKIGQCAYDVVNRKCRRFYQPTAGVARYWKKQINRRERRIAKQGVADHD